MIVKFTRKELTEAITQSVISYFVHKRHAVFKELGLKEWGRRRVDILSLTLKRRTLTIVEVKSCHEDFKSDTKWKEYLEYSNILYIAVPFESSWIDRYKPQFKELGVGIISMTQSGTVRVVQNAKRRTMKKRIKYALLTRIAWRCASFSLRTHAQRLSRTTESGLRYQELALRKIKN